MTLQISNRSSVKCPSTQSSGRCTPKTSAPERNAPSTKAEQFQPGRFDTSVFEPSVARGGADSSARAPGVKQALEQIDALLNPPSDETAKDNQKDIYREVLFDSVKVGSKKNTDPSSGLYKKAKAQVEAHQKLEQDLLGQLPREDQQRYQAVKESLMGSKGANPVAALALQKLLFEGRVPGGKDLKAEGNVLQHLAALAGEAPLHEDVNRKELLGQLVQELATPSAIAQGGRGTCAPTALSIDLNIHHPAEYARLMRGLATPKGEVELLSGQKLVREPDTSFEDDNSGRALTQRLMAPALMEKSNGKDNYRDSAKKKDRNAGATAGELDELYDAVYGRDMKYMQGQKNRGEMMKQIDSELKSGQNVMAGIYFDKTGKEGGHKVLVTGTAREGGKDYIQYINPWGKQERMERAEFESRLKSINYDPNASQPSTQPSAPGNAPVVSRPPSTPVVSQPPSAPVVSRPPSAKPEGIQALIMLFQSFIDQLRRMLPAA
ncbi:MAG TPA: hypothetical protein VF815_46905 [Myxococcaceae bacterium]|jgi:hypothetical protein